MKLLFSSWGKVFVQIIFCSNILNKILSMEKDIIDEMLVEYLYYNQKTNIAKVFYFLVYYLEKHQVL